MESLGNDLLHYICNNFGLSPIDAVRVSRCNVHLHNILKKTPIIERYRSISHSNAFLKSIDDGFFDVFKLLYRSYPYTDFNEIFKPLCLAKRKNMMFYFIDRLCLQYGHAITKLQFSYHANGIESEFGKACIIEYFGK